MKLEITKASEVQVKSVEWLWYPYIPYGKVTVLQGEAGDGNSGDSCRQCQRAVGNYEILGYGVLIP